MSISLGTRIGPYEISAKIGEGGMGVVFLARDTKLGRSVAMKVLPEGVSTDRDRLARFQREAQVLASLNHPNIAQIYGLEESAGTPCIVMELVEGETLEERLRRGPLEVDEAIRFVNQIAAGLQAAHEKGITHRDLKPANIKVGALGALKLLDFGLAGILDSGREVGSDSHTIGEVATGSGAILGTPAYMAPEQARGKRVDARADTWALGCVLYEMLTGKQAFAGESAADHLSAVLNSEPDWKALPSKTPPKVISVVRNCLQKDPNERFHSAADVRLQLKDVSAEQHLVVASPRWRGLPWIIAASLMLALAAMLVVGRDTAPSPTRLWLSIPAPPYGFDDHPEATLSPDGKQVVFVAPDGDKPRVLWIRSFENQTTRSLEGTRDASLPFWSADSRSIGFFAEGQLKVTSIAGGSPTELWSAPTARGGSWGKDGTIVFTPISGEGIYRISALGGKQAAPVTTVDRAKGESRHDYPSFLPDGKHFLYFVWSTPEKRGIYIADTTDGSSRFLTASDSFGVYADGFILFVKDRKLLAQAFDTDTLQAKGSAERIAEGVGWSGYSQASYSFDARGNVVMYWTGLRYSRSQLQWFSRQGRPLENVGEPALDISVNLSQNGERIAVERMNTTKVTFDIWTVEPSSGKATPETSGAGWAGTPMLSAKGDRVFFSLLTELLPFRLQTRGTPNSKTFEVRAATPSWLTCWSSDEKYVLFTRASQATSRDVFLLDTTTAKERPVLNSSANETGACFSQDMKHIAYSSDRSGQPEIYINSWPDLGHEQLLSASGGIHPLWSKNDEIFYVTLDRRKLLSVDLSGSKPASPQVLFNLPKIATDASVAQGRKPYAVEPGGQRVLLLVALEEPVPPSLVVGFNWRPRP